MRKIVILCFLALLVGGIWAANYLMAADNYAINYVNQSDWGTGATINVTITNNTTTAVNGWTLTWTFPGNQTITNLWNGTYTQSGASVTVKDAGFNANIPASGGTANFGFNLNYSGTNAAPTNFTLTPGGVSNTPTSRPTSTQAPTATPTPTVRVNTTPTPTTSPSPTARLNTPTPTRRGATPTPTQRGATPTPTRRGATSTPTPTTRATATPTPTSTPTPTTRATSTPTPTGGTPGALTILYKNGNPTPVSQSPNCSFRVQNNTSSAINLSNVKIRYWSTFFTGQAQNYAIWSATAGSGNITVTFTMMSSRTPTADCIMEIGFTSGAGTLAAGATSDVVIQWNKPDWSNYNQANDYSWDPSFTDFGQNTKITGYLNGSLVFGTEPPPATPTPTKRPTTPTATPTPTTPTVTATPTPNNNLALNRNCSASSQYDTTSYLATNICDGRLDTRWSSAYSDPQWIYVDLGRTTTVNRVKIYWETACASAYQLQISSDATNWTAIYDQPKCPGNTEDITITNTTKGRYLRMYATTRATQWGDSIWEFEVYGTQEGPAASFTMDKSTPVVNQTVTFDGSGSSTPSGTITAYNWDFGDGVKGTGKSITHAYTAVGNYRPTLTITTDNGATASIPVPVTVYTPDPKALFTTSPKVPNAGQATTFDASASWDANGTISSYAWNFGDGTTGSGKTATHTYSKDGFYSVKLTLTDNDGLTTTLTSNLVVDSTFAPPLHVEGSQIIDANGKVVVLKGFAVYDPIYWQEKDVIHWKNDWKVNVVRLVMITDRLWYNTPADKQAAYLQATDNVLKWCRENKIYVILDGFHEGGNTGDVAYHFSACQAAWNILAPRYKNQDHIIWEIYNEPYNTDWTVWVPDAEKLVDIIRSYNPVVQACIVPGVTWAQDAILDIAQVNRPEIIYSFHPYPHVYNQSWTPDTWDAHMGYIKKYGVAPIVCDEWGWNTGEGNRTAYGEPILKYFINSGISWTYWGMFPGWGGAETFTLVTNVYGAPEVRTEGGDLVYNYLNGLWP